MTDWWLAATSSGMWIIGLITMGNALLQTYLFYGTIKRTGQKLQLKEETLKRAVRASLLTSLGPSIGVVAGMFILIVALGGAIAFIRESAGVGSIMFELIAANSGAEAAGAELSREGMTGVALAATLWAMASGSVAWVLIAGFGTRWLPQLRQKLSRVNPALMGLLSIAIMLGAFSRQLINDDILPGIYAILSLPPSRGFRAKPGNLIAGVIGLFVAIIWIKNAERMGKPELAPYFMIISIIFGVIIAQILVG